MQEVRNMRTANDARIEHLLSIERSARAILAATRRLPQAVGDRKLTPASWAWAADLEYAAKELADAHTMIEELVTALVAA